VNGGKTKEGVDLTALLNSAGGKGGGNAKTKTKLGEGS